MQLIDFSQKLNEPIVVCLGYFGCMHKGHVALLEKAKLRASECGAKVALFTFSNNHLRVLGKDANLLYTFDERLALYKSLGADYVLAAEFTDAFRNLTGAEFVQQLKKFNLKGVVCGFDYTYGADRHTSDDLAKALAGICSVDVVAPVCWQGKKVSTTLIRQLLAENQLALANELLSESFFVVGNVVSGRKVGAKIGFPTANIQVDSDKLLPTGVFGGKILLDGVSYKCIVNVGDKPTFGDASATVEAHLIGFEGDLYGRNLKVSLTKFLRNITKFESANELARQLRSDMENVLND